MADRRTPRFPTRRVVVIAVVVVVVGGGAAGAWAATRPAGPSYRVATAGPASVTDSLAESGTIQPVSQATVMFPTAGLVSSVAAELGQHVAVGQQLAQLNTTALDNQVSADQSSVATAQAKLATDQDSQTADPVQTTSPSSVGSGGHSGGSPAGVSADQNAVRKAQQKVDADLTLVAAAEHKVSAQGAACQSLLDQLKSPPPTTTSTAPSTQPTPTGTTTVSDCETLINAVLSDESRTGSDEHTLSSAVATLSTELNKTAAAGQSAKSSDSRSSGSSGSAAGSGSGGGGRTAAPVTADQIAADQAQVDAANAQLAAAQQNRAAATLVSPIAGTVADVTITEGQNATANSADAEIVVIGTGQDEVTTAVTDNQVGEVKAGERATITPDGATKPISGQVTQVGALSTTTSSGAAGYPVTISLNSTDQQLFDGATATVSITLNTARAAVTVPTSAIRTLGGFSLVTKMVGGTPRPTRVTVGVRGPVVTQVTSGLKAGDQVELADVTAPMPTSGNTPGAGIRIAGGGGGFARRAGG